MIQCTVPPTTQNLKKRFFPVVEEICFLIRRYSPFWGFSIKRENCPFCGNRWIRKNDESPITCPNCGRTFYSPEQLQNRNNK